jgi:predicted RNase H-like HicB family nuclease
MTTYDVVATPCGDWWALEVPSVAVFTQSRSLDDVAATVREAIALALDLPEEQVTIGEIRVLAAATPNSAP